MIMKLLAMFKGIKMLRDGASSLLSGERRKDWVLGFGGGFLVFLLFVVVPCYTKTQTAEAYSECVGTTLTNTIEAFEE